MFLFYTCIILVLLTEIWKQRWLLWSSHPKNNTISLTNSCIRPVIPAWARDGAIQAGIQPWFKHFKGQNIPYSPGKLLQPLLIHTYFPFELV